MKYMKHIVTIVVLFAALYIILSRGYDQTALNFAYFVVGSILAYWLAAPQRNDFGKRGIGKDIDDVNR